MAATAALFKRRLNPVLLEFILQFQQVVERPLVICVDPHPLHSLRFWIDRVDPERDLAGEVTPDIVQFQSQLTAALGAWPVVVVPPRLGVRPNRLPRVREPVHEPPRVLGRHLGRCQQDFRHRYSLHPFPAIAKRVAATLSLRGGGKDLPRSPTAGSL